MPKAPEPSSTCQNTTKSLPRISPKSYCYNAVPNRFSSRFSTSRTNGPRLLSLAKVGTHSALLKESRTAAHRAKQGRFERGWYHYPQTVLCGSETLRGRVSERQTLPLLGLGRGESRRAQRAFGTAMRMMRVAVPRRRGPVGTCSPAAGSCAVLVSFTVCHRCVEIQERAFTRLAVPTALSALCDVQWFCPMQ